MTVEDQIERARQLEEAESVRKAVIDLNLSRHPLFDQLTPAQFAAIYNGYGPDSWPAEIRAAVTWIYDNWTTLAGVHDVDFHFSDGKRKTWLEVTARWDVNVSIALEARYPLRNAFLWPARVIAWAKLRAAWRVLRAASWGAYFDAYQARLERENGGHP